MKMVRTDSSHIDFVGLTNKLDAELNARYGASQASYDKHNVVDAIDTVIIGYADERPVACGCFKPIDQRTVEIKRMYVVDDHRRRGLSVLMLHALERWSKELGFQQSILETGKGQPEAIGLYKKCGYTVTENYGPYEGLESSVCMKKITP